MHFWCTFRFSQNLLISRKMEKHLCKFFPISKFTKLVNLLVLETQGTPRQTPSCQSTLCVFSAPRSKPSCFKVSSKCGRMSNLPGFWNSSNLSRCCFFALVPIENTSPYCSFTLTRAPLCQPPFQTLCCRRCSCNVSNKTVLILQVSPSTDHVVDTTCCQHVFASKILTCLSPDTKLRPLAMLLGCQWCTCGTHSCGIGRPWPEPSPMSTPQRQYYASAWRSPPSSSDSLRAPTTTNIASLQSSWSKYPEMDHKMKRGSCYI